MEIVHPVSGLRYRTYAAHYVALGVAGTILTTASYCITAMSRKEACHTDDNEAVLNAANAGDEIYIITTVSPPVTEITPTIKPKRSHALHLLTFDKLLLGSCLENLKDAF